MSDPYLSTKRCLRCEHVEHQHQHYRRGTDCSHSDPVVGMNLRWTCNCPAFVGSRLHLLWETLRGRQSATETLRMLE